MIKLVQLWQWVERLDFWKKERRVKSGLAIWALFTFLLSLTLFLEIQTNMSLREKVYLLERLDQLTQDKCEGVMRVNRLCEEQFVDIMQRLGLDNDMMPLVTTALWKRATRGASIEKARATLGAKTSGSGYLERSRLSGEAMGGPGPDDEKE